MGQILHGSAKTTHVVRAAIQRSRASIKELAGREMEGDGPASGITETMNFTGEPAPRAAKSSLMSPPFPPAAETWARTVVLSML